MHRQGDVVVSQIKEIELKSETYTVPEAGRILGLSRNAAYNAVRCGDIPIMKFGRRSLRVSKAALARLLDPEVT
jgi:excisionase family DNA binding protein